MAKKEMGSYNYLYTVPAVIVGSIVIGKTNAPMIEEWTAEPFKVGKNIKFI